MAQNDILEKFKTLPPIAQKLVMDFIAFLESRYRHRRKRSETNSLSEEKFVGIWQEKEDLSNSSERKSNHGKHKGHLSRTNCPGNA